jgi:hypothetical protein
LASAEASRIVVLEYDMMEPNKMVQSNTWYRRQWSNGFQIVWGCLTARYYFSGKTGELKQYHLLRPTSGQLIGRGQGVEDHRIVHINLERSIVAICSESTKG